ncbi:hypothetical protein [uncultured Anaeromusa sp.]|uniref:hypothetical protein n=1 Tax=uncultured Anaeromusa sp. TaxID=673273 RepID=UPI0029C754D4|nr:hypothetical protein [uncultured Anaeromusa sp.]
MMSKMYGQYAGRRFVVMTDEAQTEKIINSRTQVEFLELVNELNTEGFNYVPYPANDADVIVLYRGQIRELYIDYGQSPRLALYDGEQEVRKVLMEALI